MTKKCGLKRGLKHTHNNFGDIFVRNLHEKMTSLGKNLKKISEGQIQSNFERTKQKSS